MATEKLGTLEIDIKIDWQKVNRNLSRVSKAVSKVSSTMGKAIKTSLGGLASVARSVSGKILGFFTNSFRKIARIVKTSMLLAGTALTAFLIISTKMAIDVEEMQSLFDISFGKMAKDVQNWSDVYSKSIRTNKFETRGMLTTMFNMTKSMGLTEEAAISTAKRIVEAANDMKSAFNLKADIAFNKIRSGISGESEPLKQLGIIINETAVKRELERTGIKKLNGEYTDAAKVTARLNLIVKALGKANGDMIRTLDSTQNRIRAMKDGFKEWSIEQGTAIKSSKTFASLLGIVERAVLKLQKAFSGKLLKALEVIDAHFANKENIEKYAAAFDFMVKKIDMVRDALGRATDFVVKWLAEKSNQDKLIRLWKTAVVWMTLMKEAVVVFVSKYIAIFNSDKLLEHWVGIMKDAWNAILILKETVFAVLLVFGKFVKIINGITTGFLNVTNAIVGFIGNMGIVTKKTANAIGRFTRAILLIVRVGVVITALKHPLKTISAIFSSIGFVVLWLAEMLGLASAAAVAMGNFFLGVLVALAAAVGFLAGKWQLFLVKGLLKSLGIFDFVNNAIDTMITKFAQLIGMIPGMRKLTDLLGITQKDPNAGSEIAKSQKERFRQLQSGEMKKTPATGFKNAPTPLTESQKDTFKKMDEIEKRMKELLKKPLEKAPFGSTPEGIPFASPEQKKFFESLEKPDFPVGPNPKSIPFPIKPLRIPKKPLLEGALPPGVASVASPGAVARANMGKGISAGDRAIIASVNLVGQAIMNQPIKQNILANNYSS